MPQIRLKAVFQMLDKCAPGHEREEKTHHWHVYYNGRRFLNLPLGEHKKRRSGRGEIHYGFVRAMCRELIIEPCAMRELPQLYG